MRMKNKMGYNKFSAMNFAMYAFVRPKKVYIEKEHPSTRFH